MGGFSIAVHVLKASYFLQITRILPSVAVSKWQIKARGNHLGYEVRLAVANSFFRY